MNDLAKSFAIAVLLSGTACIASLATEVAARPPTVLTRSADMVPAARASLPSAVALEIEAKDGRKSHAAAFVYRADGLLLTAAHIAEVDVRIRATLPDGRKVMARTIARDPLSDVAILRIDAGQPLVPVRFAADLPEPGMRVAAIGSPLGYGRSFSAGVVSASARAYGATVPYDFIQHDAALNPGSSGGPLVNGDGEVIGMNVAIADGARHNVGIGLAVPSAIVVRIAERLLAEGAIARPAIGLRLREARELVTEADGAAIEQVEPASAAEKAGLRPGMIIIRAGGIEVRTPRDLARAMEPLRVGETLDITVRDAGSSADETFSVRLESPDRAVRAALTRSIMRSKPSVGMAITLAPATARIDKVAADSAAARAGLKPGDVILAVGTTRVDAASAEAALRNITGERLPLLVQRQGVSRYIVIGEDGRLDIAAPFGSNAEAMDSAKL